MDKAELYRSVGELIATARRERQLSQDELAERSGRSRTSISNIESGRQHVPLHTLYSLAHALGEAPQSLLPPLDVSSDPSEELLAGGMTAEDIRAVFEDQEDTCHELDAS